MTEEDWQVISSLVIVPGRGRAGSPEDALRHFGTDDGHALSVRLLREAVDRQDAGDVEAALIVCFTFGITVDHLDLLVQLESADWHRRHEDVVNALSRLKAPTAVDALYHAAWWIPDYLGFDDTRALARKAIWALGGTPGPEAEQALRRLVSVGSEFLSERAMKQLTRRGES